MQFTKAELFALARAASNGYQHLKHLAVPEHRKELQAQQLAEEQAVIQKLESLLKQVDTTVSIQ